MSRSPDGYLGRLLSLSSWLLSLNASLWSADLEEGPWFGPWRPFFFSVGYFMFWWDFCLPLWSLFPPSLQCLPLPPRNWQKLPSTVQTSPLHDCPSPLKPSYCKSIAHYQFVYCSRDVLRLVLKYNKDNSVLVTKSNHKTPHKSDAQSFILCLLARCCQMVVGENILGCFWKNGYINVLGAYSSIPWGEELHLMSR